MPSMPPILLLLTGIMPALPGRLASPAGPTTSVWTILLPNLLSASIFELTSNSSKEAIQISCDCTGRVQIWGHFIGEGKVFQPWKYQSAKVLNMGKGAFPPWFCWEGIMDMDTSGLLPMTVWPPMGDRLAWESWGCSGAPCSHCPAQQNFLSANAAVHWHSWHFLDNSHEIVRLALTIYMKL